MDDVNLHIEDNDVNYGSGTNCTAVAVTDAVITFRHLNLKHMYMKNKTAASVAKVSVVGTIREEVS